MEEKSCRRINKKRNEMKVKITKYMKYKEWTDDKGV